jgi:DNA (cytosine-5)-methyltransferase 1
LVIEPRTQDGVCRIHHDIVPTLNTAQGGQRQPCVITSQPIPIHDKATRYKGGGPTRKNDGAANGFGVGKPGDVMPTLGTGDRHAVAFQPGNLSRQAGAEPSTEVFPTLGAATLGDQFPHVAFGVDCRNLYENDESSATIQAKPNGGQSLNYINPVRQGYAVRRLTPTECLRLQGYPDWWLDVEGMSDSAKYRAIGNSVAIPCVEYVLGGIVEALSCK